MSKSACLQLEKPITQNEFIEKLDKYLVEKRQNNEYLLTYKNKRVWSVYSEEEQVIEIQFSNDFTLDERIAFLCMMEKSMGRVIMMHTDLDVQLKLNSREKLDRIMGNIKPIMILIVAIVFLIDGTVKNYKKSTKTYHTYTLEEMHNIKNEEVELSNFYIKKTTYSRARKRRGGTIHPYS